jgi:hypothetical protein
MLSLFGIESNVWFNAVNKLTKPVSSVTTFLCLLANALSVIIAALVQPITIIAFL